MMLNKYHSWSKIWNFVFHFYGKTTFKVRLHFLPPLHNGNNFSSGYLTFDIFNSNTLQYKKQMKSNFIFTYANWNINLITGFQNHA